MASIDAGLGRSPEEMPEANVCSELKDEVFEDVVFDNNIGYLVLYSEFT